jgi:hypothetical protein
MIKLDASCSQSARYDINVHFDMIIFSNRLANNFCNRCVAY